MCYREVAIIFGFSGEYYGIRGHYHVGITSSKFTSLAVNTKYITLPILPYQQKIGTLFKII